MATHSSVLAWRITGTGGLPSLGSHTAAAGIVISTVQSSINVSCCYYLFTLLMNMRMCQALFWEHSCELNGQKAGLVAPIF